MSPKTSDLSEAFEKHTTSRGGNAPVLESEPFQSILMEIVEYAEENGETMSATRFASIMAAICRERGIKDYPKSNGVFHRYFQRRPELKARVQWLR